MTGIIQPYAWGSPTFIPELLGEQPSGDPQAELWLGAHPSAAATVGEKPLDDLIEADPDAILGQASTQQFGPKLSYLFKVLAASKPLSLQVHPSRKQAESGFAREEQAGIPVDAANRLYRDDWPKPEALCALMASEVLCGFREPHQTYVFFEQLGVADALDLVVELGDSDIPPAQALETVFGRLLQLDEAGLGVVDQVVKAARDAQGDATFAEFAMTARDLGGYYPGDPGVLAALLLNRVALEPNDAIFLPAGNLHAYLYGGGIEIMANSDNVLRGGLTPKHVDVPEVLALLDFNPGFAGLVLPVEESPGLWRYPTPAPEFALWRGEVTDSAVELPATEFGRVLLTTAGSLTVSSASSELTLARGEAAFATAGEAVRVHGAGTVFVGAPGLG